MSSASRSTFACRSRLWSSRSNSRLARMLLCTDFRYAPPLRPISCPTRFTVFFSEFAAALNWRASLKNGALFIPVSTMIAPSCSPAGIAYTSKYQGEKGRALTRPAARSGAPPLLVLPLSAACAACTWTGYPASIPSPTFPAFSPWPAFAAGKKPSRLCCP